MRCHDCHDVELVEILISDVIRVPDHPEFSVSDIPVLECPKCRDHLMSLESIVLSARKSLTLLNQAYRGRVMPPGVSKWIHKVKTTYPILADLK